MNYVGALLVVWYVEEGERRVQEWRAFMAGQTWGHAWRVEDAGRKTEVEDGEWI